MTGVPASHLIRFTAERYEATEAGPEATFDITRPVGLDQVRPGKLSFCTRATVPQDVADTAEALVVCTAEAAGGLPTPPTASLLIVDNPRLVFGRLVDAFFVQQAPTGVHPSAVIDGSVQIGDHVSIGPGAVIGPDCMIGDGCTIGPNVVLERNVRVGRNCTIRAGSTLGHPGFGIETDTDGSQFQLPHIGGVVLENDVTIGAQCTVVAGTLNPTRVCTNVMTDDHVHIAHNVEVGARTLITACAEISGSVTIGPDCWLGPNCSIMNKVTIGARSMIGLGATVTKSFPGNVVIAGAPARVLKKRYPE